ncbi:glutathione S-transferase family protein [Bradyrhizobium sp. AUGA SZCCT0431]|uniref:glutathione S-transferase family protein n=1 Tax=Bradyrhizobium sp. AUGA SZCCT0431 TaxID=2807674 RepID=UPI001BAAF4A8|nr:glutathione S-transferase N-terminal domain-containing protein [Bradyrhizobium sp. AUGA SZCCT0431]MBR1145774.1 glutathione S-transferase N-terminal domain-containing protein [Bradyrhizobium sp. AUGA SZCCT0431]
MMRLHYYPGFISLAVHILIEEIGLEYELSFVNLHKGPSKNPSYLALHPDGLVPVLENDGLVLYESTAIILHLLELKEGATFIPEPGSALRPQFYKWLMWLSATLHADLSLYLHPNKTAASVEAQSEVRDAAERRVNAHFDRVEEELARHRGPWFLGDTYSAVDAYLFTLARWSRGMPRSAASRPQLGAYLQRMIGRPAMQRAHAQEHLPQPWI